MSNYGHCLQVEGPPGTGKSQTIANIISNALYHDRNVLFVCDKRAAINQVEERLSNCNLKPTLLNLHDEDLDKRNFLDQATLRFRTPARGGDRPGYPIEQVAQLRKTLNDRVRFGRSIVHPSLKVSAHQALAGMIQLRKEIVRVPNISIADRHSLSKERLDRILRSLAQWPDLNAVLRDHDNVWNKVRTESFDNSPDAAKEIEDICRRLITKIEDLQDAREDAGFLGINDSMDSDRNLREILALVDSVINRPICYALLVGNPDLTVSELDSLHDLWSRQKTITAKRYPVDLNKAPTHDEEMEAKHLLEDERVESWEDLSACVDYHKKCRAKMVEHEERYSQLCRRIGLVYSRILSVRRAQLQTVIGLRDFVGLIPRQWWVVTSRPTMLVNAWIGKLRACIGHSSTAPLPPNYLAVERIAPTHWRHVEAMAEHGFNLVSYCLNYVNDRKCKHALQQIYPAIPIRGDKRWHELTLHAVSARDMVVSLRETAEAHFDLKELTEHYLSVAHDIGDRANLFLEHEKVTRLQRAARLVERCRERDDLFQVTGVHWQAFWESPSALTMSHVDALLSDLDSPSPSDAPYDNIEEVLVAHEKAQARIAGFLERHEVKDGDRKGAVAAAFAAQMEYSRCREELVNLGKYLRLQSGSRHQEKTPTTPDWDRLHEVIIWRDDFERRRGERKLDVDSNGWSSLRTRLSGHIDSASQACRQLGDFFEIGVSDSADYSSLRTLLDQVLDGLPLCHLWLEKKRWCMKIGAFPEVGEIWDKVLRGDIPSEHAERLFCFNLLRLCNPIAEPRGSELQQTVKYFAEGDENLDQWVLDRLKLRLHGTMYAASATFAQSESEIRRLSGLQRIRGTVREILNKHCDYLLAAKRCWMMSPTSIANLIDSAVFERKGVPFDLVVFDEASQIRVLDGLLSMTFGKQVIIVGDRNQLPPTDFFAGFAGTEGEMDIQDFGNSESLLDEFAGVFEDEKTHVMLMSHYRSETPDLIRFSNQTFYGSKLEMYPPAHVGGVGCRLHYVPNGIYQEGTNRNNPEEAKEVVTLIENHIRESSDKSLGVVTMNISQMELIDDMLQSASVQVRGFCSDDNRFFLRNLETVQGDEMDRIVLSLTYGKNEKRRFNASILGPLIKSGGERRLNVAITRSRSGMTVVSSMKSSDLEASGAQSRGFHCLKDLLIYLESMGHMPSYGIGSERFQMKRDGVSNIVHCESPFEQQVAEFLENEGYEIECQYGAGNFRLDIVVKERGRNLLAIECDGAAYHSSLVARTRDRARQKVLENKGWRIHRVWSTNWWEYEQSEKEAIIVAINSAQLAKRR